MFTEKVACPDCGKLFLNIKLHSVQVHHGRPNNRKQKGPNNIHLARKCYKKLYFKKDLYSKKIRAFNNYFGKSYFFRLAGAWQKKLYALQLNGHGQKQYFDNWHGIGD